MANDPGGRLLVLASVVLSLGGIFGFVYLFLLDLNVYWIILSPVILAVYELPAVYVYWLFRRRKARRSRLAEEAMRPAPKPQEPRPDLE
jgi:Ca2+/Na+ antiporter